MSTYSQSEVARIVESVLPDIRESGDAHTTLIKRATELNLPPSVLEKAGQVYNTAKTLNHLDGVDEIEKRGNTFTTLDVPAMVEAYTGYDPKERSKPAPVQDLWSAAVFDKAASARRDAEYELPEDFNPLMHGREKPLEKMASKAQKNSFEGEDRGEVLREQRKQAAALRDLETCHDLVNTLERNFLRKAAAIADQYLGLYVGAPAMDQLEAETVRVTGQPELVKQAFDKVEAFVARHPASAKHIKRASEDQKVGLVWETGYHDLVKQALHHLEMLNAAREEYGELEKAAAIGKRRGFPDLSGGKKDDDSGEEGKKKDEKNTSTVENPPVPLEHPEEEKAKPGDDDEKKKEPAEDPEILDDDAEVPGEDGGPPQAPKSSPKKDDDPIEGQTFDESDYDKPTGEEKEDETEESGEELAEEESLDDENKRLKAQVDNAKLKTDLEQNPLKAQLEGKALKSRSRQQFTDSTWNNPVVKAIRERGGEAVMQSMQRAQHDRQAEIDNAGLMARGEAALNTLLLTDPVISEYDEEQMRDIFFTVLRENPAVATDINELRGILRAAGSFDGVVDIETSKQLKSLNKLDREAEASEEEKEDK